MKHRILLIAVSVLLAVLLCACGSDYTEDVKEFAMIAESDDLSALNMYPNLEYVDLRGSTCYDAILQYMDANPQIRVRYNVNLGNSKFNDDVREITLYPNDFEYQTLIRNLKYLPRLEYLRFVHMPLSPEQLNELKNAYPNLKLDYSISFSDHLFEMNTKELDLSFIESDQITDLISILSMFPELSEVRLSDNAANSNLSPSDVKLLVDAFPDIHYIYSFKLYGKMLTTSDTELVFDEVNIGNDDLDLIRDALNIMRDCKYVLLDSCGIDDSNMAALRSEYPDKEIVWRIFVNRYSMLTNEEMIRMTSKLTDQDTEPLRYCTNVKYLDLSYNKIADISFLSGYTELECAILTLTNISDLTPLVNCRNLTWLELFTCTNLEDISCLAQMNNLKYLNISMTKVTDISELSELPLERFICVDSKIDKDDLGQFQEQHPQCLVKTTGSAVGYAWRYNDKKQKEPFEYYERLCEIFRYNDKSYKGNTKEK